jgi:hypothetical protein
MWPTSSVTMLTTNVATFLGSVAMGLGQYCVA